jgi:hypothetical protein
VMSANLSRDRHRGFLLEGRKARRNSRHPDSARSESTMGDRKNEGAIDPARKANEGATHRAEDLAELG